MRILLYLFAATEMVLHNFAGPPATGADPIAGLASDAAGNLYGTTPDGGAGNSGVVFRVNPAGGETILYSFTGGADGGSPQAGVTLDSAGNIYGTTSAGGGKAGAGVVFKLDPSGHETVLYTFTGGADGSAPYAGVIRDASGNLYGTTRYGGAMGAGTVYRLDSSSHETVLYSFKGGPDGYGPLSGLVLDAAGNLYGTTATANGCNCSGIVYKVDPSGNQTVLYSFTDAVNGSFPSGGLIIDAAGNLYGTASYGGIIGFLVASGVVYKVSPSGQETVLYTFSGGADGGGPYGGLAADAAGNLYGTAGGGQGTASTGLIFRLDTSGHETVLYSFTSAANGAGPSGGLLPGPAGQIYGTTHSGGAAAAGTVFEVAANGNETVLCNFSSEADGYNPNAGLTSDPAGNFYGTTLYGGTGNAGVVFKLDATGQETVLYSFTGGLDGANPYAGVTLDAAGNLYGTTFRGGSGNGVVYKLDPSGTETVLYTFTGGADGGFPYGNITLDTAGNLYGTTYSGGGAGGAGVVFKVDPSGNETVLFNGGGNGSSDFQNPTSGVIFDAAGNLYGTTYNGESVYKLDPAGNELVLYVFGSGPNDGSNPWAGVIFDGAGNLYGTTLEDGAGRWGTVYKLDPSGKETVLYGFRGQNDGGTPYAGVIPDSSGNLYGTTYAGGASQAGVVYKVDPAGHETVLYSFTGGADGGKPYGGLVSDAGGNLYGTTYGGGTNSGGVVFKIAPQFTIAGQVASDGTALAGVTMTLSGSATGSAITDNNGNYGLAAAPGGSYTVTPSMVGFTFAPASISFTGLSANQTVNFAASALNYTISGQILGPGGTGLSGVGVQAAAYTNGTVTDSGGNYSLSVPAFGNYTITPNRLGYYFSPGSVAFNDLSSNETVNFLGTSTDASDFNHAGYADVVWQDPTTGAAQIWYLGGYNGLMVTGSADVVVANSWRIAGIGDFNRDGSPDLLWQDPVSGAVQVWYLGGSLGNTFVSAATIAGRSTWKVVSVADFNRDGYPDLLWQDPKSGAAQIWYLGGAQGTQLLGAANVEVGNAWRIAGAADFNGDGVPDIVWQDPVSGTVQVWYMGGTTVGAEGSRVQSTGNLAVNPWRVAALAIFNPGGGQPELVFQDPVSGSAEVLTQTFLPVYVDLSGANSWVIAGPH